MLCSLQGMLLRAPGIPYSKYVGKIYLYDVKTPEKRPKNLLITGAKFYPAIFRPAGLSVWETEGRRVDNDNFCSFKKNYLHAYQFFRQNIRLCCEHIQCTNLFFRTEYREEIPNLYQIRISSMANTVSSFRFRFNIVL